MLGIWYRRRFRMVTPEPELSAYLESEGVLSLWKSSAEHQKVCRLFFKNKDMTKESYATLQNTALYNNELKKWVMKHKQAAEREEKEALADMWHWETEVRNKVSVRIMEFESDDAYKAYIEVYGGVPECMTIDGEVTMIVSRVKPSNIGTLE